MWSFHNWVRAQLRDNMPVDEFVRDIITAEGSTFTDGPANYFRSAARRTTGPRRPRSCSSACACSAPSATTTRSRSGARTTTTAWPRSSPGSGTKNSQEFGIFGRETVVYLRPTGEADAPAQGRRGQAAPARRRRNMDDPFDRRKKLADWLTAPDNPFFARNLVNRFWGYLMGRGLVEPLDDMRATNPASNPELLDALAADFVEAQVRPEAPAADDLEQPGVPAVTPTTTPGNKADAANVHFTRYTRQAADGGATGRRARLRHRHAREVRRACRWARGRSSCRTREVKSFLLDMFGRPAAADHLRVRADHDSRTSPRRCTCSTATSSTRRSRTRRAASRSWLAAKKPLPKAIEELYLATLVAAADGGRSRRRPRAG